MREEQRCEGGQVCSIGDDCKGFVKGAVEEREGGRVCQGGGLWGSEA